MRKFLENLRKNIFLYTIIFLLLFIISHFVLNIFNIQYRQWIYWSVLAVFIIGIILGIVQIVRKKDENIKTAFIIMGMFVTIIIVAFWKMFLLLFAFLYTPEHVIEKDDKKYVAYVDSFLQVNVNYYDYINSFIMGNKIRIREDYGNGGYDPFDGKHDNKPINCDYYDKNGKIINNEDNSLDSKITNSNDIIEGTLKENISNDNYKNDSINEENEILYEKKIDDKKSIRVIYKGSVLAQRSIIGIEKTYDGGKTWIEQLDNLDKFIQIHNGAKFVFINENVGFINDPGIAGTSGDNRELLVTINGGKTFEVAKIHKKAEDVYIEDVPYEENGILKLKAYTIENLEEKYIYFHSENNGLEWQQY